MHGVRLNRFDWFALIAVIVTTILFLGAALHAAELYASAMPMSVWQQGLGCSGWLVATFGPITVAAAFWRLSKRAQRRWIFHALLLPLTYGLVRIGAAMMLLVIGSPDFDDTIGGPIVQADVLWLLAIVGYYAAVVYVAFRKRRTAVAR